ncbi:biotin/lipoyl-containing protein [Streptomyces sp. SAJ15]|uniref:acetyl-CoA carboxylase biotin carboxyl carrier protein n=1 Tax=Streptomyces sp. SAJ15 TaxID=2011095 RepID=UPI0021B2EDEA|nr:biotin/lipoyl-containing protein [Streptomyces sp. SAJ15]
MTTHDDRMAMAAEHPENGHVPGVLVSLAHGTLDAVCHSVAELVRASRQQPVRIRLQHGQTTVEVEWPGTADGRGTADGPGAAARPAADPVDTAGPAVGPEDAPLQDTATYICAPTVGTFYHSPEPGAPPFVSVGDTVRPGQSVGILEVMKMMSPVEATVAGRVAEIVAADAQPVEFQQRLIRVEPLTEAHTEADAGRRADHHTSGRPAGPGGNGAGGAER